VDAGVVKNKTKKNRQTREGALILAPKSKKREYFCKNRTPPKTQNLGTIYKKELPRICIKNLKKNYSTDFEKVLVSIRTRSRPHERKLIIKSY